MAVILGIALVSTATLIRINNRKPSSQITLLLEDSEMVTGMSSSFVMQHSKNIVRATRLQLFLIVLAFICLPIFDIYPNLFLWYDYNVNEKLATDPSPKISTIFISKIASLASLNSRLLSFFDNQSFMLHLETLSHYEHVPRASGCSNILSTEVKTVNHSRPRSKLYAKEKQLASIGQSRDDSVDVGHCSWWVVDVYPC